ncbi:complex I assembly factor TIMMDC1, mitochondrial [Diabrotica undecimpunctata]|uniref:complex I assembly factor TIMMDC1, mitochondrial n=1 Tax=Diabrotica undecimpunctata TaxID=50387 RepID=UPI003B638C74
MFLRKSGKLYCFLPLSGLFDADKVQNLTKTELNSDKTNPEETGWDRLKKMFQVDEFGNVTNEAQSILHVGALSIFLGAIYGGVINSRQAYMEFMRSNEATSFKSHLDAKRKLQDAVTISFGKGAFKWGWRLTLFSTSFVAISTMIQVYKGSYGISEYTIAGTTTGALYKFNMGPRGWIVGGALGGVLGTVCGGVTCGILKLAGISMEEARYWQKNWKQSRVDYFNKGVKEYMAKEDFAVIKLHDDAVGEQGKDINVLNVVENKAKETNISNK